MPRLTLAIACVLFFALTALAQPVRPGPSGDPQREEIELVQAHDRDDDGWLNRAERAEARKALAKLRESDERPGPRGGRGPRVIERDPAKPGPKISPRDVPSHDDAPLYDLETLRTVFLTFEGDDWESELADFRGTDVDVPATMIVDGRTYPGVGVHFRGASSYMRIPAGYKRSFNVSVDFTDEKQRLYGHKTLNLLNGSGDASMMSAVLYAQLAAKRLPVPKANFVKVVINGEYWGVYVNVQQFDKIFTKEAFGSSKGTRWKVPGSPRGDGGLRYHGADLEPYRARYEMKSNDGKKAWAALVDLCRVLNETPTDRLVESLSPILDIDETLWFLAYDVALVNSDGYWSRASDYNLFRDRRGQFHLIPHDVNEAFHEAAANPRGRRGPPRGDGRPRPGPGGARRGPNHGDITLDPLIGVDDARMPLRSRLLAIPELRARYLKYVKTIAEDKLDWERLGPRVARLQRMIGDAIEQDTRKLDSHEAFLRATSSTAKADDAPIGSLQRFVQRRRAFLLSYEAK